MTARAASPRRGRRRRRARALCCAAVLGAPLAVPPPAAAQPVPLRRALPQGQALPSNEAVRLNAALARVGRNPRDVTALVDAGDAALATGDVDAAAGFFRRADQVSPDNPRVLSGLAGALTRGNDPLAALPLFGRAEQLGARTSAFSADRGLAYDLVGDNARAQQLYREALAGAPPGARDPDTVRRLALSLAIAGQASEADAVLAPLLQAQDKAAWRTRVFILAILGRPEDAIGYARRLLPANLAEAMAPYLRYMPKLTRAQQAAAANFGAFPRAADIGHDDPRIARYAQSAAAPLPRIAAADRALVPAGVPLGPARADQARRDDRHASRRSAARETREAELAQRAAPPEPLPVRRTETVAGELPPLNPAVAAASAAPAVSEATAPARPVLSLPAATSPDPATPAPATTTAPMRRLVVPDLASLAGGPGAQVPAPAPAPAPASAPTPPPAPAPAPARALPRIALADAFSDIGQPAARADVAAGAVDITHLVPPPAPATRAAAVKVASAKPAPEKPAAEKPTAAKAAKPAPPSHPSRIWVQVGVGRDKAALGRDWRKLDKQAPDVIGDRQPFTSEWGQTNRMLAGPFASEAQAGAFAASLRKAGVPGPFTWISPAGQVVDALPAQ